jgi:uncharacterized protein (DUF433 family)
MTELIEARLTIPEAAFVSGLSVRDINREIDAKIISVSGRLERKVQGADLFYLVAIKDVRTQLNPALRKHMRRVIVDAAGARENAAKVHRFVFLIDGIRNDLASAYETLEQSKQDHIEIRGDVLHGEPVISGTRISARHIAELAGRGATRAEIRDDFDLTDAQIDAAVVFGLTRPKRGRPATRKNRTTHVSPAR